MRVGQGGAVGGVSNAESSPVQLQSSWRALNTMVEGLQSTVAQATKDLAAANSGWKPKSTATRRAIAEQETALQKAQGSLFDAQSKLNELAGQIAKAAGVNPSAGPEARQQITDAVRRNALPDELKNPSSPLRRALAEANSWLSSSPSQSNGFDTSERGEGE